MKTNCKKAFTLAETLITLTIIGIIAALTLPTVVSNYRKKLYVAALQNTYNQFSNGAEQALVDSRMRSFADTDLTTIEGVGEFLKKYFRVVKDCGVSEDNSSECFAASYKNFDKTSYTLALKDKYCVTFNTGVSACMGVIGSDSHDEDGSTYHGLTNVIIDINGKDKPNINGRDVFGFEFYTDAKISEGYNEQTHIHYCAASIDDNGYAAGCLSKIMDDGWKMDY